MFSTDTEAATFTNYPSDISVNTDPSQATAVVSWVPPTVMDNSGDLTVTSNYDPNDVFPIGGTVVTYIATDGSGNNVSYSFTITVNGWLIVLHVVCTDFVIVVISLLFALLIRVFVCVVC